MINAIIHPSISHNHLWFRGFVGGWSWSQLTFGERWGTLWIAHQSITGINAIIKVHNYFYMYLSTRTDYWTGLLGKGPGVQRGQRPMGQSLCMKLLLIGYLLLESKNQTTKKRHKTSIKTHKTTAHACKTTTKKQNDCKESVSFCFQSEYLGPVVKEVRSFYMSVSWGSLSHNSSIGAVFALPLVKV